MTPPHHGDDLRGINRLTVDAITGVVDLVEQMHASISQLPGILAKPVQGPAGGIAGLVYRSIRGVTGVVGNGLDAVIGRLSPLLDRIGPLPQREAAIAALNGVLGDHLDATGNPLAITMELRSGGTPLPLHRGKLAAALPDASGRLLVLAHGLCMNDLQWNYGGHDHGAALARDLGYTPVYLRYNSGRHISENGRDFAALLKQLVRHWPVPVERLAIVCHSMGGLVTRSACLVAEREKHAWLRDLDTLVFLGTPHHGASLERAGSWADMLIGLSPYSAPFVRLGKMRSAGIQDLRYGNVRDEDWHQRSGNDLDDVRVPTPLPRNVAAHTMAASTARRRARKGQLPTGDGLVSVSSALGRHADAAFDLQFPEARQRVMYGVHHLDLLGGGDVYRQLKSWLK